MGFQDRLKNLRQSKNLTQQELAKTIFVSRSAIAKWENGLGVPSDANLKALCEFFNVDENWLLDRDDLKVKIKAVKIQVKNILISLIGILLPIAFALFSFAPLYHFYYEPGHVYPMVYHAPGRMMHFLNFWTEISALLIWGATVLFSVLNVSFLQFGKKPIRYFIVNSAMVGVSVLIFIALFVASLSAARQIGYYLPL